MDRTAADRALVLVKTGVLQVGERGEIWRLGWHKTPEDYRTYPTPRRAEAKGPKGYLRVVMWLEGKVRHTPAHRLVWEVANGPIPAGLEINHKDGNKQNNALGNLELVSAAQNSLHAVRTKLRAPAWTYATKEGRAIKGRSFLPEETILAIVSDLQNGEKDADVAAKYGLAVTYVHGLRYRRMGKIPKLSPERRAQIESLLKEGATLLNVVKLTKTAPYTVINIRKELQNAGG